MTITIFNYYNKLFYSFFLLIISLYLSYSDVSKISIQNSDDITGEEDNQVDYPKFLIKEIDKKISWKYYSFSGGTNSSGDSLFFLTNNIIQPKISTNLLKIKNTIIGKIDPFGREMIYMEGSTSYPSVLKLGAIQQDGDPVNVESEGIVIIGKNPYGVFNYTNWAFTRIKSDRIGINVCISNTQFYIYRMDPTSFYIKNNYNNTIFNFVRSNANLTISGNYSGNDYSGISTTYKTNNQLIARFIILKDENNNTNLVYQKYINGEWVNNYNFDEITTYFDIVNNLSNQINSNIVRIGSVGSIDGIDSIGIGNNANAIDLGVAIGSSATAAGTNCISIGSGANSYSESDIAIGNGSQANGLNSIAIGTLSQATNDYSISLGFNSMSYGLNSIAIGKDVQALGENTISIGEYAYVDGMYSLAIGNNSTIIGDGSVVIGPYSYATNYSVAIGYNVQNTNSGTTKLYGNLDMDGQNIINVNNILYNTNSWIYLGNTNSDVCIRIGVIRNNSITSYVHQLYVNGNWTNLIEYSIYK